MFCLCFLVSCLGETGGLQFPFTCLTRTISYEKLTIRLFFNCNNFNGFFYNWLEGLVTDSSNSCKNNTFNRKTFHNPEPSCSITLNQSQKIQRETRNNTNIKQNSDHKDRWIEENPSFPPDPISKRCKRMRNQTSNKQITLHLFVFQKKSRKKNEVGEKREPSSSQETLHHHSSNKKEEKKRTSEKKTRALLGNSMACRMYNLFPIAVKHCAKWSFTLLFYCYHTVL